MDPLIDWGVAARPRQGERESGDQYLLKRLPHGTLIAVVDGLGHGTEGHAVAARAIACLETHALMPLVSLMQECHVQLLGTRGAAITLASLDTVGHAVHWLGVGNVEAVIVYASLRAMIVRHQLPMQAGVVGYQLPTLRERTVPVQPADLLLMATDGIRSNFMKSIPLRGEPQDIADELLARFGKSSDDALLLAVRWKGD